MEVTKNQKQKISEIAKDHGIKMMVVFGSQVSGKIHQGSDLDIGILLNQEPDSYHRLLDVQSELKKVFPEFDIDARYLHNVTPYFLFEAVYRGKLLYGSNYEYVKLCAKAFKIYVDTKSLRDLRDEIIKKRQVELLKIQKYAG
ncbi:MAG: nucleotidyltransferase domain-containing protein [Candidatus Kuenenbacteria bacterium]